MGSGCGWEAYCLHLYTLRLLGFLLTMEPSGMLFRSPPHPVVIMCGQETLVEVCGREKPSILSFLAELHG